MFSTLLKIWRSQFMILAYLLYKTRWLAWGLIGFLDLALLLNDKQELGATIMAVIAVPFMILAIHYIPFLMSVYFSNALSRALDEEPALSSDYFSKGFNQSFKRYKNIYPGNLYDASIHSEEKREGTGMQTPPPSPKPAGIRKSAQTDFYGEVMPEFASFPGGPLYYDIKGLSKQLPDGDVKTKVEEITGILSGIFENFEKDGEDIERSVRILPELLAPVKKILEVYNATSGSPMSDTMKDSLDKKVIEILARVKPALENHFESLLENDLLSLNTEIGLLKNIILSEGLQRRPDL